MDPCLQLPFYFSQVSGHVGTWQIYFDSTNRMSCLCCQTSCHHCIISLARKCLWPCNSQLLYYQLLKLQRSESRAAMDARQTEANCVDESVISGVTSGLKASVVSGGLYWLVRYGGGSTCQLGFVAVHVCLGETAWHALGLWLRQSFTTCRCTMFHLCSSTALQPKGAQLLRKC